MPRKVRWGVLGAARIALRKVIPAMQAARLTEVVAIASRDLQKARRRRAGWESPGPTVHEELLAGPQVEAVYNPCPTPARAVVHPRAGGGQARALREAIALSVARRRPCSRARPHRLKGRRPHGPHAPAGLAVRDTVRAPHRRAALTGELLQLLQRGPRERGGARLRGRRLLDIGAIPSPSRGSCSRRSRARAGPPGTRPALRHRPLAPSCSTSPPDIRLHRATQVEPYIVCSAGTRGRIEVEVPSTRPTTAPPDLVTTAATCSGGRGGAHLSRLRPYAIRPTSSRRPSGRRSVATPLEDAVANTRVLEAVFRSAGPAAGGARGGARAQ